MADGVEKSLIDLNCSIKDAIFVPLLPLPRLNIPYDGEVSSDDNNPFDSAIQAVSYLDDPFEFVSKKAQEFTENGKSEESGIVTLEGSDIISDNGEVFTSGVRITEAPSAKPISAIKYVTEINKTVKSNENETNFKAVEGVDLLSHVKGGYDPENSPQVTHVESQHHHHVIDGTTVSRVDDISTSILAQATNFKYSPESVSPKYCSTPLTSITAPNKRKVRDERSPHLLKRKSLDFGNLSPASLVKARVEKCIAETENKYRTYQEASVALGSKHVYRRSLDSQMPNYYSPSFEHETSICDQNFQERSLLNRTGNVNTIDFYNSLKSLQNPTNTCDLIADSFPYKDVRESFPYKNTEKFKAFTYTEPEAQEHFFKEAKIMSMLFEAQAKSESLKNFLETDIEDDSEEDVEKKENRKTNSEQEVKNKKVKTKEGKGELHETTQNEQADTLKKIETTPTATETSFETLHNSAPKKHSFKGAKGVMQRQRSLSTMEKIKTNEKQTHLSPKLMNKMKSDSNVGAAKRPLATLSNNSTSRPNPQNKLLQSAEPKVPQMSHTSPKSTGFVGKAPKALKKVLQGKKPYSTSKDKTRKY